MDLGIAGKVAVVTGGSHGIGRAVSEELGRNGCRVVVVARGRDQLDSTVSAIERDVLGKIAATFGLEAKQVDVAIADVRAALASAS